MGKKVLITAGGTGGHIYPALALADQLRGRHPGNEILFAGGNLSANRYFAEKKYAYKEVACAPMARGVIRLISDNLRGFSQSLRILKEFQPDVVVGFGSYYTLPTLLAAKCLRIPIVLHEANSIPGKVNRLLARCATVTGIHFPETAKLLGGNVVEVGMPLREEFALMPIRRDEAALYFGLSPTRQTLLVFGGSQGAQAINALFPETLRGLDLQVIHIAGHEESAKAMEEQYRASGIPSAVKGFETRMDLAWHLADLAVARSGAGTVAEMIEFEVPTLFIPFPYAADQHQGKNAETLVKRGRAFKLNQQGLTDEELRTTLSKMLAEDRLDQMRAAIRQLKQRIRPHDLCSLVMQTVNTSKKKKLWGVASEQG